MRSYLWCALALVIAACRPSSAGESVTEGAPCSPLLPASWAEYSDGDAPLPGHFRRSTAGTVVFSDNTPPENRITNAGATLGRVLFYDVRLSATDDVACASCHLQEFGFGDTLRLSKGIYGRPTKRRTLALANARFNADGRFFWDQRAASLEAQVLQPIQDTMEMGMDLDGLERKLSGEPIYPALFAAAFGSPQVTREGISRALAQFVRSLVSSESRFDAVFLTGGAPDESLLTDEEREGYRLFNSVGCAGCHRSVTQFADKANNNGLDLIPADTGAGGGQFKAASLRNVAVRPPYMHDGRFADLREVVEFYDHDVQDNPDLDPRMREVDGTPRRLGLTTTQVNALVAFMGALTDSSFLKADRFSDPFSCARRVDAQ
jgi:cytochrome c peroxidase